MKCQACSQQRTGKGGVGGEGGGDASAEFTTGTILKSVVLT